MDSIDFETIESLAAAPMVPLHDANSNQLKVPSLPASARRAALTHSESVMIVDDEIGNIDIVKAYLEEEGFEQFLTTTDSSSVVETIRHNQPDLVLLNLKMPGVGGLEILQEIRGDERICKTPVIMITAATDRETKERVIGAGATDLLAKPVIATELVFRIEKCLDHVACETRLSELSGRLDHQVNERTAELLESRQEAILCLARAAEYRDDDTGQHVTRVGRYTAIIADELGFPKAAVELIEQAAQLHDVGKIGVPDSILHKPGKLDTDEMARMKRHCGLGRNIMNPSPEEEAAVAQEVATSQRILGSSRSPVLRMASLIADSHHEKWDGTGYPKGLKGTEIPLEGRIVAVADVFDALSSKRPYKEAFPPEKCFSIIMDGREKHFDPRVLDAFLTRREEVLEVVQPCHDPA